MLTKYSLLFLLLSTNFILTNSVRNNEGKAAGSLSAETEDEGKEKAGGQSELPQQSHQQQQFVGHKKDKGKEIAITHQISAPHELPANKIIELGPKPKPEIKKRTRSARKVPTILYGTNISNFRQMVQQVTGMPEAQSLQGNNLNEFEQQKNMQNHPIHKEIVPNSNKLLGTSNDLIALPEQISYEQPMGNFPFHQQTYNPSFTDQQKKKRFILNLGNDSIEQIAAEFQQQGIGANKESPGPTADENQARGQLELEKGVFILNSAKPFPEVHQQHGIGVNSGIHRPTGNAEGSGSGKYSHHQFLGKGKSSGNEESNQKLSGSETESYDGMTQQLSQKTSEPVSLRALPPEKHVLGEYQKPSGNSYYKPDMTGIESSDSDDEPYSMEHVAEIIRQSKSSSPNATGDNLEGSGSVKSESRKRKYKNDSTSSQGGTSKLNPIETGKIASQKQKELSHLHSSQSQTVGEEIQQAVKDNDEVTDPFILSLPEHYRDDFIKRNKMQRRF